MKWIIQFFFFHTYTNAKFQSSERAWLQMHMWIKQIKNSQDRDKIVGIYNSGNAETDGGEKFSYSE